MDGLSGQKMFDHVTLDKLQDWQTRKNVVVYFDQDSKIIRVEANKPSID